MVKRTVVVTTVLAITIVAWCATIKAALLAQSIVDELDRAKALSDLAPRPLATIVYDRYDHPAFTFFIEQRIYVPLDRVSPHMIDALLAVEDQRFFSHHGMDPIRIAGAAWQNFRSGRITEGWQHDHAAAGACLAVVRTHVTIAKSERFCWPRNSSSGIRRRRSSSRT